MFKEKVTVFIEGPVPTYGETPPAVPVGITTDALTLLARIRDTKLDNDTSACFSRLTAKFRYSITKTIDGQDTIQGAIRLYPYSGTLYDSFFKDHHTVHPVHSSKCGCGLPIEPKLSTPDDCETMDESRARHEKNLQLIAESCKSHINDCIKNLSEGRCVDKFMRETVGATLFPQFYPAQQQVPPLSSKDTFVMINEQVATPDQPELHNQYHPVSNRPERPSHIGRAIDWVKLMNAVRNTKLDNPCHKEYIITQLYLIYKNHSSEPTLWKKILLFDTHGVQIAKTLRPPYKSTYTKCGLECYYYTRHGTKELDRFDCKECIVTGKCKDAFIRQTIGPLLVEHYKDQKEK